MNTLLHLNMEALPETLSWNPPLTDEEFEALAQANDFLHLERTKEGKIIVHAPAGDDTGSANAEIIRQLGNWQDNHGQGRVYDSSTGFFLPDGSNYSPDAAYVRRENIGPRITKGPKMAHHCPDFVIELLLSSDRLARVQVKMQSWIANGAALGWLVDLYQRQVTIYAPKQLPQTVSGDSISGSGPVEGFILNLTKVWHSYET